MGHDEFKEMVYDMGHCLSETELHVAVTALDTDGSGKITFDEFTKWWANSNRFEKLKLSDAEQEQLSRAVQYFRYFDKDGSGVLDRTEFASLHADLVKNKFTTKTLDDCLKDLDSNRDNKISFNEYVDWLVRIGSIKRN